MKKFTRLLFTLVLLCAVGVNVVSAQTEQVALTKDMFYTWNGFGASASSTGSANVEFNLGNNLGGGGVVCGTSTVDYLTYADISGSLKIIFEGTKGLPLRLLTNRQESNNGPLVEKQVTLGEDGKGEIDLTDQAYVHINAIKVNWGGSGQVTSIKIEKPADPVELAKGVIKKTISAAKTVDGSIYTTESYNKLKTALAAAEAALSASSVETIEAANAALNTAIDALVYKIGMSDLTKDLFINHDNNQPAGCSYVLNSPNGLPYGDGSVFWKNYADLSEYSKLIVTVSAGVPRFGFNRTEDQAQYSGDPKNPKFFSIPDQGFATEAYQQVSGNVYTIDIAKIVADYGFAYLHCIKGANFSNVTVTGMYLLKVVEGAKDEEDVSGALAELRQAITQAKTVNTESASEYRQNVFSKTLSEAQMLVAIAEAGDATVGWIRTMMTRIDNAVNMLYVEDPEVIPYEPKPITKTYTGLKKELKKAIDAAAKVYEDNTTKPEKLRVNLAAVLDQAVVLLDTKDATDEWIEGMISKITTAQTALENASEEAEAPKPLLANGTYYIYNVGTGKYLAGGANWGTHASVNLTGIDFQVALQGDGKYTLDSQLSNGGNNHYINGIAGDGPWNDGAAYGWTIAEVSEGVFTISNGNSYMIATNEKHGTEDLKVVYSNTVDANAQWMFITPEKRLEETRAAFATASEDSPVDVTYLIKAPNFGRNDLRNSAWTFNASNKNISGGNNTNNCAESYHAEFTLSQKVSLDDGKYLLKAQAFYRQDGSDNEHLPVIFANDKTSVFPLRTGTENDMGAVSNAFSNGLYEVEPIILDVVSGELNLGTKLEGNTNLWCIWDNFRLYYVGPASADNYKPAYFNLQIEGKRLLTTRGGELKPETRKALDDAVNGEVDVNDTNALKAGIENLKAAIAKANAELDAITKQFNNTLAKLKDAIKSAEGAYNVEANQNNREEFGEIIAGAKAVINSDALTVNTMLYYIKALEEGLVKFLAANKPVVEPGKVYIQNVATGKWWGAGNNWGTQASLLDHPEFLVLAMPSGYYTMETQVNNGGTQYYFEGDFMDNGNAKHLNIEKKGDNMLISADGQYYGYDGSSTVLGKNIDKNSPNALWRIYSHAEMMEQMKQATAIAPVDATFLIMAQSFGRNNRFKDKWEISSGTQINDGQFNNGDNAKYSCGERYRSDFSIKQLISEAPAGLYAMTAQGFYRVEAGGTDEVVPVFFANDETAKFPVREGTENTMVMAGQSFATGMYTIDPIYVEVKADGDLTIGARLEGNSNLWSIFDNFTLTYYGPNASIDEVKNSAVFTELAALVKKAEELKNQVSVDALKTKLTNAISSANAAKTVEDVAAATAELKPLIDLAEANVKAKDVLPKMKEFTENNNFVTPEALNEYYGQWVTKYEDGTLTKSEANALQDPTIVTGWHADITADNYLMSTWDAAPNFADAYYINTWSVEGDNDGTGFHVPFFEYWTGDDGTLAPRTLTATLNGVPAGKYTVSTWVRVRRSNSSTDATQGITFSVNGGQTIDACDGEQVEYNGTMFLKKISTEATVGSDGVLTVQFDVVDGNNISWLAFRDVKYFDPNATAIKGIAAQKATGEIYNLQGQKVEKTRKGLYIINGKKVVVK